MQKRNKCITYYFHSASKQNNNYPRLKISQCALVHFLPGQYIALSQLIALLVTRDEWVEAIQMVADKLAKQEEEGILCSPISQIENVNEEEMDTSTSHHKRKVEPEPERWIEVV